jgi:hypothetical protein
MKSILKPFVRETTKPMKRLFILTLFRALSISAFAAGKTLFNVDKTGLALKGYDPVGICAHRSDAGTVSYSEITVAPSGSNFSLYKRQTLQ